MKRLTPINNNLIHYLIMALAIILLIVCLAVPIFL